METETITPLHDRLILQPSDSIMRGSIFIPEQYTDASTCCRVLSKGSKVSPLININDVVLCEVGFGERQAKHIEGTRNFWCRESNIYAVFRQRKIYPMGRKILIRRDIEDAYHGNIVVPTNRRYQSLTGSIERIGISRMPLRINGISVGDKIQLSGWMPHMIELELEDGAYGLIVNDMDLLFKHEN